MTNLHHMLARARRRTLIDHGLNRIGWGLAIAAGLAAILLMLDRLAHLPVPELAYWIILGAGAAIGIAWAVATRLTAVELAVHLDRSLRLKDRMGTATAIGAGEYVDPDFAALVNKDAEQLAGRLDVRSATPIRLTRIWAAAVPGIALVIAGVLYLPAIDWADRSSQQARTPQQQQQLTEQSQQIAQTIQNTVAELPRDESLDERTRADLEALDRLSEQLAQKPATPEELAAARDESAARMTELAEQLARQSQRDLAAADEVVRRFSGLDRTDAPKAPMSAREFEEALKRGDFGNAAQRLEELLSRDDLTAADRLAAAEHLRELASQIEQLEQHSPAEAQQLRDQLSQAMQDQGIDEQTADELLNNPPPEEELEQRLNEDIPDEEIARQLARDLQQQREHREIEEQADEAIRDVKDSLRQAADELERPPSPPTPEGATPPQQQPSPPQSQESQPSDSQQQQQQQQQQQDSGADQQDQSQPSGQEPPSQQSPQGQQPKPDSSKPGTTESPQQQPGQQPTDGHPKPGEQPTPQGAPPTQDQQQQKPGAQPDPSSPQQQPTSEPTGQPQAQDQQQPGDTQQPQPGQQQQEQQQQQGEPQPGQQQQPGLPAPDGTPPQPPAPSEAIRKLAERMSAAKDRQQISDRMKQAAREMAERMTPEERDAWARQWQRERGMPSRDEFEQLARGVGDRTDGPPSSDGTSPSQPLDSFDTENVDIGGTQPADRTLAEWLSDAPPEGGPSESGRAPTSSQRIRQAQQVAERAVDQSAVQKRYHRMIQRYFGRLPQTIEQATESSTVSPAPSP